MSSDWHLNALCAQVDPDLFSDPYRIQTAKRVCLSCPALDSCLQEALDLNDVHGVRGGLAGHERIALQRRTA